MNDLKVRCEGKGESSTVIVAGFRLTQAEARKLVNDLSHVVVMPPSYYRRRQPSPLTDAPKEKGR